jgi:transposase, IS5 family
MLKFRRLLNEHELGEQLFAKVGDALQQSGFKLKTSTIVDATIIGAPSSTKNADNARDPEMHQTKKGQQWCFGMKLHIGVDSCSGLAHSAMVTAADVHDKHALPDLLHGAEHHVYGDSAYSSQKELIASKAPRAKDFTTSVCATLKVRSTRPRARRTTTSRASVLASSTYSVWSSLWAFAKVRYRGQAPRAHSRHLRWPTSTSAEDH